MTDEVWTVRPARGQRLPKRERREQLLDAATEVFVAGGYHTASMDDIADRAGVSKPVLYQHFPGKLDLYIALLERERERLGRHMMSALMSSPQNVERVHAMTRAYYEYVDGHGDAYRLVFESDLANDPQVALILDRLTRDSAEQMALAVSHDTGIPLEEAMIVAVGMCGLAEVSARAWVSDGKKVPRERAVELVGILAWGGMSRLPMTEEAVARRGLGPMESETPRAR